jgi:hypothetical protein
MFLNGSQLMKLSLIESFSYPYLWVTTESPTKTVNNAAIYEHGRCPTVVIPQAATASQTSDGIPHPSSNKISSISPSHYSISANLRSTIGEDPPPFKPFNIAPDSPRPTAAIA